MADAWRFQHHLGQQEKWTRSVVCEAKHELKLQIDYDHSDHYDLYKKKVLCKKRGWHPSRKRGELIATTQRLNLWKVDLDTERLDLTCYKDIKSTEVGINTRKREAYFHQQWDCKQQAYLIYCTLFKSRQNTTMRMEMQPVALGIQCHGGKHPTGVGIPRIAMFMPFLMLITSMPCLVVKSPVLWVASVGCQDLASTGSAQDFHSKFTAALSELDLEVAMGGVVGKPINSWDFPKK